MQPQAKPFLDDIPTYKGGKTSAADGTKTIKLSSNENPYGASPKALEAFRNVDARLHRYPEDGCRSLREAIAEKFGFPVDRLICGNGSDDVIRMVIHAYAGSGDEVLYPEHAFLMYRIYGQQYGATPVSARETNLTTDVDAVLEAVTDRTRIVFVANPNNPTGSYINQQEVTRLRSGLREDIILVLDGAYAEYMEQDDYSDGRELVLTSNTVITRTFSKAYGLPALRIGWGYGPKHILETMYKVRSPFNVNQGAIAAALAALADDSFLQDSINNNRIQRERLVSESEKLGLKAYESHGNFVLIEFANETAARNANTYLMQHGIIPREVANYGLPSCLRITVGTEEENTQLLASLSEFIHA